jgi:hypothetical protein
MLMLSQPLAQKAKATAVEKYLLLFLKKHLILSLYWDIITLNNDV